jgi:hypothetical protein
MKAYSFVIIPNSSIFVNGGDSASPLVLSVCHNRRYHKWRDDATGDAPILDAPTNSFVWQWSDMFHVVAFFEASRTQSLKKSLILE